MADHFVGFSRGVEGGRYNDFTTGAASTAGLQMELRVTDGVVRKVDVQKFLEALERFIENPQQYNVAGFNFID